MKCPHCDHNFTLKWSNYLRSPFRRHHCPSCQGRLKIILTASSFLLLCIISVIAAATPTVIVFFLTHNFWYTAAAYLLFIAVVILPFDRWLDNNVRPVKPLR